MTLALIANMSQRLLRNSIIVIIGTLITFTSSCNRTLYFHHHSTDYKYSSTSYGPLYIELKLHSDGTFEEYIYPRSYWYCAENCGFVYIGRYFFEKDTLFLTTQNWELASDSTWTKSGRKILQKFRVVRNKLNEVYYIEDAGIEWRAFEFKRGKSNQLRRIEKIDSIFWTGYESETSQSTTIRGYSNLTFNKNTTVPK